MNCPHCGAAVVCSACHTPIELRPSDGIEMLEDAVNRALSERRVALPREGEAVFLVVARGHRDLLIQLEGLVGEVGWVHVMEDRRHDRTLLPREGREGTPFSR